MDIFEDINDGLETPTVDENVDYVELLVGEGKKFKDVSGLARGKAEADAYIKLLEQRLDEANKELTTRTSLESFMDQMKAQKNPVQPDVPVVVTPDANKDVGLDDSEIERRLEALLAKREAQRAQETNAERVKRVLQENLGDKQNQFIKQKAQELGMSTNDLSGLATKSPSAFFRLVGIEEGPRQPAGAPVAKSSVNTFNQSGSPVKNKAYFEKMKKDNPTLYRSPKTTGEMMRAMAECKQKGIPWE